MHNLFNQDTTLGLIPEGDSDDILFVATQIYRLNIVFAQHIAVWCGDLLNDIGASLQTCEDESAVGRSLTLSDDCASSTGGAAKETARGTMHPEEDHRCWSLPS